MLRALHGSSIPIPTVTLCESNKEMALSLVRGGPGRLTSFRSAAYHESLSNMTSYILRVCQSYGKGRDGTTMTPISAFASSLASKWASVALTIVIFVGTPTLPSTSFFKDIRLAMISALCASTTSVISPYRRNEMETVNCMIG